MKDVPVSKAEVHLPAVEVIGSVLCVYKEDVLIVLV